MFTHGPLGCLLPFGFFLVPNQTAKSSLRNPTALSINNTTTGGYDSVLLLQQTDSGGTTKLAGGIGLVGTGPWTAGNNASQVSDMYFLVKNDSGGISERMRIKSSGNVGIGTTSPSYTLDVQSNVTSEPFIQARFLNTNSSGVEYGGILVNGAKQAHIRFLTGTSTWGDGGAKQWQIRSGIGNNVDALSIYSWTNGEDIIYFNSSGNVGIGTTNPLKRLDVRASVAGEVAIISNDRNSTGDYAFVTSLGSNCNNTSAYHYIAATGGADRFYIYGNGTYTTVSDRRLKKDITKVTENYLDKVSRLNIVKYHWNEQSETDALEFGMIAQEVEELIPSIVQEGREDESGNKYKGIQSSVLPYILIKAIQEQNETITKQGLQINELKQLINK
jgi:hypothetical protein